MKIQIENYRNIKTLDLEIQDNKINFIAGISGSGKSSLAMALAKGAEAIDWPAGEKNVEPRITPSVDSIDVDLFDKSEQESLLFDELSKGVYQVILRKGTAHREAEDRYVASMEELQAYRDSIRDRVKKIDSFLGKLKLNPSKEEIEGRSAFKRTRKAVEADPLSRREIVKEHGGKYLTWISDGVNTEGWGFAEHRCPFCWNGIDDVRYEKLSAVAVNKKSDLGLIADYEAAFSSMDIDNVDLFKPEDYDAAIKVVEHLLAERHILHLLLEFMDLTSRDIRDAPKPDEVIIRQSVHYDQFPGLQEAISRALESSKGLRESFGVLAAQFKSTLEENGNRINVLLRRFGIPYEFVLSNLASQEGTAAFSLRHINANDATTDYKAALSYGEQGIVALVLFLLRERPQDTLVVIDDPVSSYDEIRRLMVYRTLMELDWTNTVVVLSHDHVFLKYALLFHSRAKADEEKHASNPKDVETRNKKILARTGDVFYLINNFGDAVCNRICVDDYAPISEHITKRLQDDITYIQKVINSRLLFETQRRSSPLCEAAYGYFSAILHCVGLPDNEIEDQLASIPESLKKFGYAEDALLEELAKQFGIEVPSVDAISSGDLDLTDQMCEFELIAVKRERDTTLDNDLKDEMNDLIHMNSALVYCLNPYSYTPYSNRLRSYLVMT